LIGNSNKPIVIDGPVVVPGDVVIRGVITGRGTIYAGRNIHFVGDVTWQDRPRWWDVERDVSTGQLRQQNKTSGPESNLGTVCNDGTYVVPGGAVPPGCP
ncbi:MAG: hypothetical protein HYY57_07615, partial [Candidatus Omnitrophica bacterium]|nr:hypothetical protein [Candidatus Omnitrophota bacterium]